MPPAAPSVRSRRGLVWGAAVLLLGGCDRSSTPKTEVRTDPPAKIAEPVESPPPPRRGPPVRKDGTVYGESELMGTRVSINVYVGDEARAAAAGQAMQAALDEMARIEGLMSEWKPETELSNLNRSAGGEPMEISPELFEVLAASKTISEASQGAFDVTFHAVGQLWSFRPGARPPSRESVRAKLPLVDYRKIELSAPDGASPPRARLSVPGMMVGLGAIAKGYAVDRASKTLVDAGFPNHVVEAGGDTYAAGTKNGKPWMIGVQDPGPADGSPRPGAVGALPAVDVAIVTSGDYQRFFEFEGQRYAHILDPRTGWPIPPERSPKSVTAVSADAMTADAYCTAIAVMGPEAGMAFVESRPDLDAIIITKDGEVRVSSGLVDAFQPLPPADARARPADPADPAEEAAPAEGGDEPHGDERSVPAP